MTYIRVAAGSPLDRHRERLLRMSRSATSRNFLELAVFILVLLFLILPLIGGLGPDWLLSIIQKIWWPLVSASPVLLLVEALNPRQDRTAWYYIRVAFGLRPSWRRDPVVLKKLLERCLERLRSEEQRQPTEG
jgi:hypothetical protein